MTPTSDIKWGPIEHYKRGARRTVVSDQPNWMAKPPDTGDEWHVLIVRALDEDGNSLDDDYLIYHPPTCGVTVTTAKNTLSGPVRYECHFQNDLDNAGFDGMFNGEGTLEVGVWLVAPYVYECRGLDYVEYDGGWTVVPLAETRIPEVASP